jgi:prepilin-type N-terminal cleavage/methylation domain-containing protein
MHRIPRMTQRPGFSLVEIMVALVMLVIILSSLAGLSIKLAGHSTINAARAFETGLLTQEIDRAVAVPIESLAVRLGQTSLDTPVTTPWPFSRSVAITGCADSLTVRIAIKPLTASQQGDSVVHSVLRTR